jgi:hypothetical protein
MTGSNSAGQDEPCSSSETTQETKIHWERQLFYLLTRALMGDPFTFKKAHPTTWQNKLGRKIARTVGKPAVGQVGKVAGRAAVVVTVADGFFDLGLVGGCAAACAGE